MKVYYTTSQPDVLFDPVAGIGYAAGSQRYSEIQLEVRNGTAKLEKYPEPTYADKRRCCYLRDGLTAEAWMEAVVEFLGTLPKPSPKFREMWGKREAIRARFPKPNGV